MCKRNIFVRLMAVCMVFCGISAYSLLAAAENENEFSEQSFAEESIEEEEPAEFSDDEEEEESFEDEDEDEDENSYDEDDENQESDDDEQESSHYYYFDDEESSYDYYDSEPESREPSYYEPSIYRETTEYYYDDDDDYSYDDSEPSSEYREISVDTSELTSNDWEKLRERLSSEMKNKSSDNAIRDIKDSDSEQNDSIAYLIWGLVLIAMGLALIGFVVYTTVYTKRKFH